MIQAILAEISRKRRIHLYPYAARDERFVCLRRPFGAGLRPARSRSLRWV